MMTRKDYIKTAEILNLAISMGYITEQGEDFVIGLFAEMFQRDNARFDRNRFVDHCLTGWKAA